MCVANVVLCEERGLAKSGSKSKLRERIRLSVQAGEARTPSKAGEKASKDDKDDDDDDDDGDNDDDAAQKDERADTLDKRRIELNKFKKEELESECAKVHIVVGSAIMLTKVV